MEVINPNEPVRLKRSRFYKMIGGVCGGLAKYFKVDSTLIRLAFAFAAVFAGTGVLAYIVMWIIVPQEDY